MSTDTAQTPGQAPDIRSDEPRKYIAPSVAFGWDKGDLAIVSAEVLGRYNTQYLSASTAKAMDSCPARWAAEKAMPSSENPFGPAELGTSAHTVMEDLFDLANVPAKDRTPEKAMTILLAHSKVAWPGKDEAAFAQRALWISAVHDAYKGLFAIEDPTQVSVYQREMRLDGVEVFGVPFKGFIDRVDHTPEGLRVVDYKTGKVPQNITRFGDHEGDQIRLYVEGVRAKEGVAPATGALYYTRHSKSRTVPLGKPKMNEVAKKFQTSWKVLNASAERAAFATKTSALCGWCVLVNSCPAAQADGKVARVDGAPSKVELGIPVLRTFEASELTPQARKSANIKEPDFNLDFGSASLGKTPPVDHLDVDPGFDASVSGDVADFDVPVEKSAAAPAPAVAVVAPVAPPAAPAPIEDDPFADPFEVPAVLVEARPEPVPAPAEISVEIAPVLGSAEPVAAHLEDGTPAVTADPDERENTMSDLLSEGKPWEETVGGSLNPAAYASTAVFGITNLAYEEIIKAGVKPSKVTIDGLATTFAAMVDESQQRLTGVSSFQDAANTRLRGALHSYLEAHPLPFGKDQAAWDAWVETGKKHMTAIASAAVRLYSADLSGKPWSALAIREADDGFGAAG